MKLFISKGLWGYRGYQIKTEPLDDNRSKLIIPNVETEKDNYENIEFVLPVAHSELEDSYKNLLIDFSRLRSKSNEYVFEPAKTNNSRCIYALLHYDRAVPSEIYVPANMKGHIEVLKTIQFHDLVPDYGDYLAKVYFVKITLSVMESIPLFLSFKNPGALDHHLVFKNGKYHGLDVEECKTCIYLNTSKRTDFVALSDL